MSADAVPKMTPDLEEELREKLERLLDESDEVSEKRSRVSKLLGGHVKVLKETVLLVRRQLKGLDLDQLQIPGTEVPEPARDPLIQGILQLAGGIISRDQEAKAELEWVEDKGRDVAQHGQGRYAVWQRDDDSFGAVWEPDTDPAKTLGAFADREHARKACHEHQIEAAADAMLKAAGDGALTKAGMKGPATKFKKGGGRA